MKSDTAQERWDLLTKLSAVQTQERKNLLKLKRLINKGKTQEANVFIDQCLTNTKPSHCTTQRGHDSFQATMNGNKLKERSKVDPIISKIMDNY